MSGNLKHVKEMSGIMLTVRELSGKCLVQDVLKKCGPFAVCFDESSNKVVHRGQMDVVVPYFDKKTSSCCTQYLTLTFLGRARAEDLLTKFKEALSGWQTLLRSLWTGRL